MIQFLFTKAVPMILCKEKLSAEDMGKPCLDDLISRGSAPSRLLSDMGPQFVAQSWRNPQQRLGMSLSFPAPYHQQANPVERAIQAIEIILRGWCDDGPHTWSKHLKMVELCFNSTSSSRQPLLSVVHFVPVHKDATLKHHFGTKELLEC